jgi:natural resistance-associated macrophage protein
VAVKVWVPVPDRAHRTPGRHTHWRVARRRHLLLREGAVATMLAVVGPGLLAGLLVLSAVIVANTGTLCAEFAGVAAAMDLLGGMSRYLSVPLAAIGVSALVLRESFRHVEHFLLALSSVFVAFIQAYAERTSRSGMSELDRRPRLP